MKGELRKLIKISQEERVLDYPKSMELSKLGLKFHKTLSYYFYEGKVMIPNIEHIDCKEFKRNAVFLCEAPYCPSLTLFMRQNKIKFYPVISKRRRSIGFNSLVSSIFKHFEQQNNDKKD